MSKRRWLRHRPLFVSPVQTDVRKPKIQWRILPILGMALSRMCMTIGAIVLFGALIGLYFSSSIKQEEAPALPKNMVLYLTLDGDFDEKPQPPSFASSYSPLTVHQLVDVIDRASTDARVKGIMARMEGGTFSMARSEEVRDAIKRFRAAGKFAYVYSSSYGEGAGDLGRYYLAAAFQEIWMQPLGIVSIGGMRAEIPFGRDLLNKIGVMPQFYHRKEYKTAYESFTNSTISPANKEEMTAVVGDIRDEIMKNLPADRGLKPEAFEALVDKGLFTAPEAIDAKLLTHMDYADNLVERIKKDVTGDPDAADDSVFVDPADYMRDAIWKDHEKRLVGFGPKKPEVALIYVVGLIMESDNGGGSPLSEDGVAASEDIAPAILDAADDDNVQAIVLRVDSPGGSPVASESILRAVEKAKRKGKPVIVSMGSVAASGGYWVSAYADQIFAQPTTLTGSIGVLGGKFSGAELSKKLGVNWDRSVQWGKNSGLWSVTTPFSDSEAERINAMLDEVYDAFVARVAKGRGLTPEQVDKIAGGRVWTGMRASKIGLVDQIGGLREAMDYTATILGEKDRAGLDIEILPRPRTAFERLIDLLDEQGNVIAMRQFEARVFKRFGPAIQDALVLEDNPGGAAYEPLRVK